jgi:DNA-binding CsgD family transcriptional regulator
MLATANIDEARAASDDLVEVADRFGTDELRAMAIHTVGSVDLAEGNAAVALGSLRQAFELWQRVDAPYESARVRLLIGQACCLVGDDEAGEMEFEAAKVVFDELGAAVATQQGDSFTEASVLAQQHPLTPREAEVLRLIAAGKTNKTIAEELFLSERTIDRHVSNILTKLQISSRSAATAYAYRNKLV